MKNRKSAIVRTALGIVSLGWLALPRAQAQVANPSPPPAGAIQVGFRGAPVQNIQVRGGDQNQAIWLANQFNNSLWAYTFAGEMLVVDPKGTFVMADFQPTADPLPWVGTMGPNSPLPGAAIGILQIQVIPESWNHPPEVWAAVEVQGDGIDVVFDQLLVTIYSYNTGT